MGEKASRGSLTFFTTYRPTVRTAIFSCPFSPKFENDEICLTPDSSYNYTGQNIPPQALKNILNKLNLPDFPPEEVDKDLVSGLLFVSERNDGLETLHFSISHKSGEPQVFQFSNVYGTHVDIRMEDSGCFAGDYLIYVSTIEPVIDRRQPWTAVYKTNLITGETTALTPPGKADLSPAVSPNGTKIVVASFEDKDHGWNGEIEYQNTNIFVMNIEEPYNRTLVVKHGGWPTWGSENVLFFHKLAEGPLCKDYWCVFKADISIDIPPSHITLVTPNDIDAFTPAAVDDNKVAVVTIRKRSKLDEDRQEVDQFRHVEIFTVGQQESERITRNAKPLADHYNPFVLAGSNGAKRIGYHRSILDAKPYRSIEEKLERIKSPYNDIELFRVSGAFPSISPDLSKLAFVDNEFKKLYAVNKYNDYILFKGDRPNTVFAPIWSQNRDKDTLYACMGPAFPAADKDSVNICAFVGACSDDDRTSKQTWITNDSFNNAFPSTNPEGTKLVYRSTREREQRQYKNLYIIDNLESLENGTATKPSIKSLTKGDWVDTHCEWSPSGQWIVFSSNRDKPEHYVPDNNLDTGYFVVYLVKADTPDVLVKVDELNVPVRVIRSRIDFAGHVNHPVFSPDGKTLAVVADLAAVSCDPISLPHYNHSVRPYGDLFFVDIDPNDIEKNRDIMRFKRATHSKYENSLAAWTESPCTDCPAWDKFCELVKEDLRLKIHAHGDGRQTRHVSGHICIAGRKC